MKTVIRSLFFTTVACCAMASRGETLTLSADGHNNKGMVDNTWSDGSTVVSAETDYVVANSLKIFTSSLVDADNLKDKPEYNIFAGKSLTIGNESTIGTLYMYGGWTNGKEAKFLNDGLFLQKGDWILHYANVYQVYGSVTVQAAPESPFRLYVDNASTKDIHGVRIYDRLAGSGALQVCPQASKGTYLNLMLAGDCRDFSGTLSIMSGVNTQGNFARGGLIVGNSPSSGNIEIKAGSFFALADDKSTFSMKSLSLEEGCRVKFVASDYGAGDSRTISCGKLVVSDAFGCSGGVELEFAYSDSTHGDKHDVFTVLQVPATERLDASDFTYIPGDTDHVNARLEVVTDNVNGTKSLQVVFEKTRPRLTLVSSSTSTGISGSMWSDGSKGTLPDYDYVVANNKQLVMTSVSDVSNEFAGNKLIIGSLAPASSGTFYQYGGYPVSKRVMFPNEGFELARGFWLCRYSYDYECDATSFAVTADKQLPFDFTCDYSVSSGAKPMVSSIQLNGPVSGEGAIRVSAGVIYDQGLATNFCLKINGDASAFEGQISVTSGVIRAGELAGMQCRAGLVITNTAMPAKVVVSEWSYISTFSATDKVVLDSLALQAGSGIKFKISKASCSQFAISNEFGLEYPVNLTFDSSIDNQALVQPAIDCTLLTVPATADITVDDFVADLSIFPSYANARLTVKETADSKTLALIVDECKLVDLLASDSSDVLSDHPSAFTNAVQWSDEQEPHEGAQYNVKKGMSLRTTYDLNGSGSFPGESLTLLDGSAFVIEYLDYSVKLLRFVNSGFIFPKYNEGGVRLHAPIEVLSGVSVFRPYASGLFVHDGQLKGPGALKVDGNAFGSGNPGGYAELLGRNADFSGRFKVTIGVNSKINCPSFDNKCYTRLYVNHGLNVGGAMSPADPMGFTVENYSQIITRNSVTFEEPTRGIFINLLARFNVDAADHVLAISSPLAFNGVLYKEGRGLLVMGNPQPTFGESAVEENPGTAPHGLVIADGDVQIASAHALDGVTVTVSNAASSIVLDVAAQDAELSAYGLVDVRDTGMPFALDGTATSLNVKLDNSSADSNWDDRSVGICTVRAEYASTVRSMLNIRRKAGSKVRIIGISPAPVTIGGISCVTLKADVAANLGMVLIVR